MTQITGKLYQMYNKETGANKERRFPITVIEGVLGLSSYLQNQFSSLADIYMPIGGIYQSKTGQEFVYRATPNTIKAKSFTLDRIQGKSLAWNQLVENVVSSSEVYGITRTKISNNCLHYQGTSTNSTNFTAAGGLTLIAGHKHYYGAKGIPATCGINYQVTGYDAIIYTPSTSATGQSFGVYIPSGISINADVYIQAVDLTILYGSEISGMTDAEILAKFESEYPGYHDYSAGKLISNDAKQLETVGRNQWDEEWELGSLTSTDGSKVSSTTQIRSKNYIPVLPNTTYYRKNPYSDNGTGHLNRAAFYDANKQYVGGGAAGGWLAFDGNGTFTTPANAAYMLFYVDATTYANNICINLSDPSFNGQYEPYRKSVLPLNLDDFWVKDGQGNQVHITGGLKSAGSVYDEIVGNKYIKRVGEVDLGSLSYERTANRGTFFTPPNDCIKFGNNVFPALYPNIICAKYPIVTLLDCYHNKPDKTVCLYTLNSRSVFIVKDSSYTDSAPTAQEMSGVMLYYELATPIEYELVEPLIYTMKAGTTEARISPNEDGLSAPFCCDMTYSASDNNDADNAQYAATAGRLLNTHKIWGKDFNGTQDVSGEMSGVTSINSLINISDGNVGIGKTPSVALDVNGQISGTQLISTVTSSAPLVVNSSALVSNLNVEKVGGKTLAEILASDITGNAKTATNAKSESKDDQEFVFRKTNVDWDAKSGVVKKIKGKTLAWNQLVQNGNFSSLSGWVGDMTKSVSNNVLTAVSVAGSNNAVFRNVDEGIISEHKYLISFFYISNKTFSLQYCGAVGSTAQSAQTWTLRRSIYTARSNDKGLYFYNYSSLAAGEWTLQLKEIELIDLTQMFGAGNEPSTVAEFEALYPDAYYPYNAGKLISNDASEIEIVGRNVWDEEMEFRVGINQTTGQRDTDIIGANSSVNYIPVFPSTAYYFKCGSTNISQFRIFKYAADQSYIGTAVINANDTYTTGANTYNLKFQIGATAYGPTYNHDICVNLSNPAINGQYFPYWKRTLQLGLDAIKVVSPNVWDEEWESGVYNDITGVKVQFNDRIRTKNFIPVFSNTEYYIKYGGASGTIDFFWYDANYNFISRNVGSANTTITSPSNAAYGAFYVSNVDLTTYNHDICINLSNPAFNGRYFPYGTLELEGGLRSGSNYDGTYEAYDYILDNKLHRKFGVINGDSLIYHNTSYANFNTYRVVLTDGIVGQVTTQNQVNSFGIIYNGPLSSETVDYETIQYNGESDKRYYISFNPGRNVEDFKLYYELQYEEVYDLAEPMPSVYPCDQYGTERIISPESTTPSAPFIADLQYGAKSDDVAKELIDTRATVQPLLDAFEYDSTNEAWRLKGNFYADGFVSAYGTNESEALEALKAWVTANFEPKQS